MHSFKSYFLSLCIALFVQLGNAQIDFRNFPMDSFRLPDIDRKALVLTGNMGGYYRNLSVVNSTDYTNSRFSSSFGLTYSRLVNRPELQRNVSASFSPGMSTRHDERIFTTTETETQFGGLLTYFDQGLHYKGQKFFQAGYDIIVDYDNDHSSIQDNRDSRLFGRLQGTIGLGNGRLEPISDVAMAMFLLMDAAELGIDQATITTESIYAFASRMAEVRNRRIFDTRRMRIAELRDLYSFMLDRHWVVSTDPAFFTVLTDNWFFNLSPFRLAGRRWSYGLSPFVSLTHQENSNDGTPRITQTNTEYGGELYVDFTRYKPVSLFRDNTRRHTLSAGINTSEITGDILDRTDAYLALTFDNSIGRIWYPNSRTTINLSLSADYEYYRYLDIPDNTTMEDQHYFRTGIGTQLNYFITYRTRLMANASIEYSHDTGGNIVPHFISGFSPSQESDGIDGDFSVSIVVSIF